MKDRRVGGVEDDRIVVVVVRSWSNGRVEEGRPAVWLARRTRRYRRLSATLRACVPNP